MTFDGDSVTGAALSIFSAEETQFGVQTVGRARRLLNEIASGFRSVRGNARTEKHDIVRLNDYLFRVLGFGFRLDDASSHFTLTSTLLNRSGNCLGLSTVYFIMAFTQNIRVYPLLYQGHIAIGWHDGQRVVPIEVTRRGAMPCPRLSLLMYRSVGPAKLIGDAGLLAVHQVNRAAFVLASSHNYESALDLVLAAIDVLPEYPAAWINRAAILRAMGRNAEAKEVLKYVLTFHLSDTFRRHAREMLASISRVARFSAAE